MEFTHKVVIVTGTTGIGRAVAKRFARDGASVLAELAAFLASDKASFCTGGDYLIDGGLLAGIGVR